MVEGLVGTVVFVVAAAVAVFVEQYKQCYPGGVRPDS